MWENFLFWRIFCLFFLGRGGKKDKELKFWVDLRNFFNFQGILGKISANFSNSDLGRIMWWPER